MPYLCVCNILLDRNEGHMVQWNILYHPLATHAVLVRQIKLCIAGFSLLWNLLTIYFLVNIKQNLYYCNDEVHNFNFVAKYGARVQDLMVLFSIHYIGYLFQDVNSPHNLSLTSFI